MSNKKVYWKGYEELDQDPAFLARRANEFPEDIPMDAFLGDAEVGNNSSTSRRDFLKFLGFGVSAATLAACQAPVQKAIPYIVKPETITPGVPNYFASAFYNGKDFATLLVKTREGRPIKVKGNRNCPLTKGGTNARIQASVLSLYDNKRLKTPMINGQTTPWSEVDAYVKEKLDSVAEKGKKAVLLTNSVISPSTRAAIARLGAKYPNVEHIQYDAVSYASIRSAHQATHGRGVIPSYHFNKAESLVSFGADFLNGWLLSCAYEHDYAEMRNPEHGKMSRHFQFEAQMSVAGSNADYRTMVKHSEIGKYLVALYNEIASKSGKSGLPSSEIDQIDEVKRAADHLLAHRGKSLVICGLNDVNAQLLTNGINSMLGNYGRTIDMERPLNMYQGNDAQISALAERMEKGDVGAIMMYGVNPSYTLPNGTSFNQLIGSMELSLSFSDRLDETNAAVLCPDHHYLESWNDYEVVRGHYAIQQPTIHPLFDTRHAQESFLIWGGDAVRGDRYSTTWPDFIRSTWKDSVFRGEIGFRQFWNETVQMGVFHAESAVATSDVVVEEVSADFSQAAQSLNKISGGNWEVQLYEKAGIGWGDQAANPILQEFPDPISRVTWDNYIAMAPSDMDSFGFNKKMGQEEYQHLATVTVNGASVTLPVLAQPGQAPGTVSIALGYGRKFGRTDEILGQNAFPMVRMNGTFLQNYGYEASVEPAAGKYQLAGVQTHHTMMGRDIIKETSLNEYAANPGSGNPKKTLHTNVAALIPEGEHSAPVGSIDYWREFKMINHRWGMSIDLNACTGCGACVVSCHVENNVPVVGKDEVRRSRDMHWLRIDRYYTSDADPSTRYEMGNKNHRAKEIPSANPRVAFMPVMCQHCNHAPCETVCPVLATTHSLEGLNQMTYNRCVGTRYCANNCPYKVRRFNWFQYSDNDKFDFYMNDDLGKMVLNPDVTVRARGVMEKCSMCVQRIQAGKLQAKTESRMVKDGEIETACQEACPTNAIIFGDFNDEKGRIPERDANPRAYYLLEEIGVKPNIIYQTKVRNVEEVYGHAAGGHHGHHGHDEHNDSHESAETLDTHS
jgi:MoCo/4Fe-4S cofactor protein with predicted Tat translocation signal